jgi:hypothetical protein
MNINAELPDTGVRTKIYLKTEHVYVLGLPSGCVYYGLRVEVHRRERSSARGGFVLENVGPLARAEDVKLLDSSLLGLIRRSCVDHAVYRLFL